MVEGEIIRSLLKTHVHQDDEGFRLAASELIAQERRLNHRLLADDLERILVNGHGKRNGKSAPSLPIQIPRDKERGLPLLTLSQPDVPWLALVLHPNILNALQQCARENQQRELLANAGIRPKQKILLCGPPGCGKTLSASALASDLGFQLATIRLDSLMSSYLGETASNLRRIFEFVSSGQYVVLFDECDSIAKERSHGNEHGELQRVVTALLQMMDGFSGPSVLVFATNHQHLLDSALWRRFDLALKLTFPEAQDRILMMRQFLRPLDHDTKIAEKQAMAMKGASGADIQWFAHELIRHCVLSGRRSAVAEDFAYAKNSLALRNLSLSETPEPSEQAVSVSRAKRKLKPARNAKRP